MLEAIEYAIGKVEKLMLLLAPTDSMLVASEMTHTFQHEALAVVHAAAAALTLAAVLGHFSLSTAHYVHHRRLRRR